MADKYHLFAEIIEKDRVNSQNNSWRGTFIAYLDKLKEDPSIAKLSHARMYDVITRNGATELNRNGEDH